MRTAFTALPLVLLLGPGSALAQDARFLVQPRLPFVTPGAIMEPAPEQAPPPAAPAYPLFTRENVARDTPDIVLEAFQDPTRAKVEAAYDWLQRRHAVTERFQALLRQIDRERQGRHP